MESNSSALPTVLLHIPPIYMYYGLCMHPYTALFHLFLPDTSPYRFLMLFSVCNPILGSSSSHTKHIYVYENDLSPITYPTFIPYIAIYVCMYIYIYYYIDSIIQCFNPICIIHITLFKLYQFLVFLAVFL